MLEKLPDKKIVEDIHRTIKMDAKRNSNRKQTSNRMQQLIMTSNSIEARDIEHPAILSKQRFVRDFKQVSGKGLKLTSTLL